MGSLISEIYTKADRKDEALLFKSYLQNDIARFRVKYSIPKGGFKIDQGEKFTKWYKKLLKKYPSKKTYDYNRIIKNKRFQNDLSALYIKYVGKFGYDNIQDFEWYILYDRFTFSSDFVFNPEIQPDVVAGLPTIETVYVAKKIKKLTIDIKPDTTIDHIKMIWYQIDNYQKQMTASQGVRVRSSNNFDRDYAILTMVTSGKMTYPDAIEEWNKKNPKQHIQTGNSAIQLAVKRLDKYFEPT